MSKGILTFYDGSVYEGGWHKNDRQGTGKMTYADGASYEGGWYRDYRHGMGKMIHADGTVEEGCWHLNYFRDKKKPASKKDTDDDIRSDEEYRQMLNAKYN
jgi:hypothetical protein